MAMAGKGLMRVRAAAPALAPAPAPGAPQAPGHLRVLVHALAGDVDDDGDPPGCPGGSDVAQEGFQADVLEADGVDHAGGGLRDTGLAVATAGVRGDGLADDSPPALGGGH